MKFQWMWRKIEDYYLVMLVIWLSVYVLWKCWISRSETFHILHKIKCRIRCFHLFLVVSAVIYIALFLYVTLLGREAKSEWQYELSFLWEYRRAFDFSGEKGFIKSMAWVRQILNNILLFVPMGVLYGELMSRKPLGHDAVKVRHSCWYKALIAGFLISLTVELSQLVFRLGLFEFDDIFNNTIGMMLGYGFFAFWRWIYNTVYQPLHKKK